MSTINNGAKRNRLGDSNISDISNVLYENLFNVNLVSSDKTSHYFYNILDKVQLPENLSSEVYTTFTLDRDMPWTSLSYNLYNDISLWWLIVLLNKPDYIFKAKAGLEYKVINPDYINFILTKINT